MLRALAPGREGVICGEDARPPDPRGPGEMRAQASPNPRSVAAADETGGGRVERRKQAGDESSKGNRRGTSRGKERLPARPPHRPLPSPPGTAPLPGPSRGAERVRPRLPASPPESIASPLPTSRCLAWAEVPARQVEQTAGDESREGNSRAEEARQVEQTRRPFSPQGTPPPRGADAEC